MLTKLKVLAACLVAASAVLFIGAASSAIDEAPLMSEMKLQGDLSKIYSNGLFVIWDPTPKAGSAITASSTSTSVSMATSSSSSSVGSVNARSLYDSLNVVAEAEIGADGKFELSTKVSAPREVYFYVLDALSVEGFRMAPVKGLNFILEPGNLTIVMNKRARFVIEGGKYNDAVFNSWRLSPEYVTQQQKYESLLVTPEGETEEARRNRVDEYLATSNQVIELEDEGRTHVAMTHPDPLVRRLTIETAWLHGPWVLESLRGLAEMTPDDPWVIEQLAKQEAQKVKFDLQRKIATGTEILDFEAEDLDGADYRLADIRADSNYVLLEFWASWCGPCRTEIPHMKEAYERYGSNGFEIVSFTIDDDRDDWVVASEEEQIPWLNLGMGTEADAPTAYSVTGVPKNYLVESATGIIVAKDLRGHKLDEKLEELFE